MIGKPFFVTMMWIFSFTTNTVEISPTYQVEWVKYSYQDTTYKLNFKFGVIEKIDTLKIKQL